MKRLFLLLFLSTLVLEALSQVQKERRVYYLDCSYSMVKPNGIWNPVCNNLITAIQNIEDETTEVIVIPFAFDNLHHTNLNAYQELATPEGKAKLIKHIQNLKPNKQSMTFHSDAINDFYAKRVSPNRVNYMFFMTDGQNQDKPDPMPTLLSQWGSRYKGKNVYGFYVMLHDAATNKNIESRINEQPQLWKVQTADVNINLVRMQSSAIFNAKNDKYFDLTIYGNITGKSFSATLPTDCPYKVTKTEQKSNCLRVWVDYATGQKIPPAAIYNLSVKMNGGGQFDFLVTETIPVTCEYKPERSLKITVR